MWDSERVFSAEDMDFAVEIAAVAGQALERVRLAERERSVAIALQNALLALDIRSHRVVVGAQYVSADSDLRVGGDWYDAIERDDGKVVVARRRRGGQRSRRRRHHGAPAFVARHHRTADVGSRTDPALPRQLRGNASPAQC